MDKILNFQLSLFGSFKNIKPDNDIAMRLIEKLKEDDFIPATVDVAYVDTAAKEIKSESRLQMVSQDKSWSIVFLQERIDLNYDYNGSSLYSEFGKIFIYAKSILEKVFEIFSNEKGNRLAVNGKILLNEMVPEKRTIFMKRFSNPPKVYGNKPITEWHLRFNAKSSMGIADDTKEICNNIIEIGDCIICEKEKKENRMLLSLDINTLPENRDLRFTYENLLYFTSDVEKWMEKELAEIEEG